MEGTHRLRNLTRDNSSSDSREDDDHPHWLGGSSPEYKKFKAGNELYSIVTEELELHNESAIEVYTSREELIHQLNQEQELIYISAIDRIESELNKLQKKEAFQILRKKMVSMEPELTPDLFNVIAFHRSNFSSCSL